MQSSSESSNQTTQTQYFYEFTTITIGHEVRTQARASVLTHAPASSRHRTPTSTIEHHQHQLSNTVPGMSTSNSQPRIQASGRTDYSHSLHLDNHPLSSALSTRTGMRIGTCPCACTRTDIISTAPIPTSSTQPTSISTPIHITSSISSISSTSSINSRYHIHHNSHHCIDRSLPRYIKSSASDVTASIAISQSAIQPVGQPDSRSYRRTDH